MWVAFRELDRCVALRLLEGLDRWLLPAHGLPHPGQRARVVLLRRRRRVMYLVVGVVAGARLTQAPAAGITKAAWRLLVA